MNDIKTCGKCKVELEVGKNWNSNRASYDIKTCIECLKIVDNKRNKTRMYVNGIYVVKTHPLYKAGSYKSFDDAAFSSLVNYEGTKEGEVYVVTNDAWPEWVKIGMAIDSEDRLGSYQTSSPHRDFTLAYTAPFDDRRKAEADAHKIASAIAEEQNNEWFKMDTNSAINIISSLSYSPVLV